MKYFLYYLFVLVVWVTSCQNNSKPDRDPDMRKTDFLIGQWYTEDYRNPHWIMFDSTGHYYRWSFDEEKPSVPDAKYRIQDSIINLEYKEMEELPEKDGFDVDLIIDSISPNSFRLLPVEGEITIYEYERDFFVNPKYMDVYFFFLRMDEVDSLNATGNENLKRKYENYFQNLKGISREMEYSQVNTNYINSRFIYTRDSTRYDKFNYGGFGVIYYRNDSTYVRSGIPPKETFFQEAESFFSTTIESN
jgi:hypothetical protein